MTGAQKDWLTAVKTLLDGFDMLDTSQTEKVELAVEIQKHVSWIRWRAGMDKECFACRWANKPDALVCVNPACGKTMICEPCYKHSNEKAWYCPHGSSFEIHRIAAANRHREEKQKDEREPREPRAPREEKVKIPRFSFGE